MTEGNPYPDAGPQQGSTYAHNLANQSYSAAPPPTIASSTMGPPPPPQVVAPTTVVNPMVVQPAVIHTHSSQMYRQQAWRRYIIIFVAFTMVLAGIVMLTTFNMGFGFGLVAIGVILVTSHFIQCMIYRRRMANSAQVVGAPRMWVQATTVSAGGQPNIPGQYPTQPYMPPPPPGGGAPTMYALQPPPYSEVYDNPGYLPPADPSRTPSAPPPSYSSIIEGDKQS